jgi:hypothetical protein
VGAWVPRQGGGPQLETGSSRACALQDCQRECQRMRACMSVCHRAMPLSSLLAAASAPFHQVWVVPELRDDGCIYWTADSDSQLTKVCVDSRGLCVGACVDMLSKAMCV